MNPAEQQQQHNILQPGLLYAWDAPDPRRHFKKIVYAQHPEEGWKVYLRVVVFVSVYEDRRQSRLSEPGLDPGEDSSEDPNTFIVVKSRKDARPKWEAPKGGVEPKDRRNRYESIVQTMAQAARREVAEEAKLDDLKNLYYMNQCIEGTEDNYGPNTYVQYHFFRAFVTQEQFDHAAAYFAEMNAADKWHTLPDCLAEKNDISYYYRGIPLFGKWTDTIFSRYMNYYIPPNKRRGY